MSRAAPDIKVFKAYGLEEELESILNCVDEFTDEGSPARAKCFISPLRGLDKSGYS